MDGIGKIQLQSTIYQKLFKIGAVSLPKYYRYFNYIYNVYMCIYVYIFKTTQIKQPLQKTAVSS